MQDLLPRIKKIVFGGLVAIGAVAVVLAVAIFVLNPAQRTANYSGGSGVSGVSVPMGAPSMKSLNPGFDLSGILSPGSAPAPASSPESQTMQTVSEGELTQRKVVKNGTLYLTVAKAEEAADSIKSIAERFNGFVSDSRVYEVSSGVKSGNVTIRIPADKFAEALDSIKKLATKVDQESVSAGDVTEQYTDLSAQLKNLRAEEEQYLEIMKKAYTVEDTLRVAQRLSIVRGSIERIQGQLQYLSRQVDMSTITSYLTSEADVEVFGISWRPLLVVKQSFRNLLNGLTGYVDGIIAFVFVLPVYLLWIATIAAIAIVAWKILVWLKRKFIAPTPKL